jgi:hypothetical protein
MQTRHPTWNKGLELLNAPSLELYNVQSDLTIKDIFDLTPAAEDMLNQCFFRLPGRFFRRKDIKGCQNVYDVEKYFYLHSMCYRFSMKESYILANSFEKTNKYTFHELKHHALLVDFFYELILFRKHFQNVTYIESTIFRYDRAPRGNDAFSVSFKRGNVTIKGRTTTRDSYHLSYSMIKNQRLPPPFHTNCMQYNTIGEFASQRRCIDDCVIKRVFRKLNKRIPFTAIIRNHTLKYKLITTDELKNEDLARKLNKQEEKCNAMCPFLDCYDVIYMTRLERSEPSTQVRFRVQTPHEPDIHITLFAQTEFKEFLVYILNCFGIWLGLSIFDFKKVTVYFLDSRASSTTTTSGAVTLNNRDRQHETASSSSSSTGMSKRTASKKKTFNSLHVVQEREEDASSVISQEGSFQRLKKESNPQRGRDPHQQLQRQTGQDTNVENAGKSASLLEIQKRKGLEEEDGGDEDEEDAIRYDFKSKKLILFKRRRQVMPHT